MVSHCFRDTGYCLLYFDWLIHGSFDIQGCFFIHHNIKFFKYWYLNIKLGTHKTMVKIIKKTVDIEACLC